MNKIKYLLFVFISFLFISGVRAESIDSIKMDIFIDTEGNAHVTEVWEAYPTEKTEYYHAYYNIGNSEITNFKVRDNEREYEQVDWDIDAMFSGKSYKYGYNYTSDGVELCWGKSKYKKNTYTLTYTITNFVSLTSDEKQMIYWNLLDSIDPAPENVEIVISADTYFEDSVPVWGYGNYGGEAYVYDGKIYLSNDHLDTDDYMVVLAEFPNGTFQITNVLDSTLEEYKEMAEGGAIHYNVAKETFLATLGRLFVGMIFPFMIVIIVIMASKSSTENGSYKFNFGETGKKVPKDTPMFRDIPCNKDIFRAYWVAVNYNLIKKKTDFLGSLILKWLKEGIVKVESKEQGVFKKESSVVVFSEATFDNEQESKMYNYMRMASRDGVLESKEFEKWCSNNYSQVLKWFDDTLDYETRLLIQEGKIQTVEKKSGMFTRTSYEVDSSMMEEAKQMYGLREFFKEFENMQDKEAIEVMLWEEYLMFAQIFGVADKVAKQFKKLYPDVITNYDYDNIVFINSFSYHGISSASAARSRAMSYSSGGGGFSSGGGGFGSFGGGGGGSR